MESIARRLRERREALGLTLRQVQEATKIRIKYLEALESADRSAFPGEVYLKGYLRAYAEHLGLNAQALLEEYNRLAGPEEEGDGAPGAASPASGAAGGAGGSGSTGGSGAGAVPMAELGRLAGRGGARRGGAGAGGPRRAARERPAAGERAADAGRAQVPARAAGARADDTFESGEPGDAGGGEPAAREAPGPSRRAARGAGRGARLGGPEPLRRRRSPATGLLLAAAFLAGAGWWIWRTETAAPGGAFTPSGATAPSEPSGTPGASGGESEPAAGGAPASETAPSETAPQVTVERSLDPDGTIVYTVRHAQGLDVSVTFTGPCWVRALADGREVEAGATYQSGDAAHWTAQQELRLTLGYAEHAQIAVDGLDQGVVAGGARVKTVRIVLAGE